MATPIFGLFQPTAIATTHPRAMGPKIDATLPPSEAKAMDGKKKYTENERWNTSDYDLYS